MKRSLSLLLCLILCLTLFVSYGNAAQELTKEQLLSSLYEADISSMREAIDLGLITCEELTAYYLERIEEYNSQYNCFITVCDDALETAKQRDEQLASGGGEGLLFGIPVVIKDNMDMAGYHTTNGHKKDDSQIAGTNADAVEYLLSEGAVILAKANMSTDAQDARRSFSSVAGETKNAYNTLLSAGGSSGGSAVSVSLNFAAAGLGTDTNSSLRMPAALNGCVSLRTTFGLISRTGVTKLNGTRDAVGAITRSVYDQAVMLDVLTCGAYQYASNLNANALEGLRIGVLQELSYATTAVSQRGEGDIDDEVAAAFENAVAELEACGAEVITVTMPELFTLSNKTFSSGDAKYKDDLYEAFQAVLAENNVSAVIYPTYLSTPLRSGTDEDGVTWSVYDQAFVNNCRTLSPSASIPEITVPIGTHSLGAGIGMEIAAARDREQLLLDIAYSYTSVCDHRVVPDGAQDLYAQYNAGSLAEVIESYKLAQEAAAEETAAEETTEPETTQAPTEQTEPTPEPRESESILIPAAILAALVTALTVLVIIWAVRRKKRAAVG